MGPSVLVVDDQAAFRAVARALLERDGFEVVGEAGDAATALLAERELRPDVVLLDVRLPDRSGLEVARAIRARSGSAVVVLISTADYTHAVAGCGARAFLPKLTLSGATLKAALAGRS
jgi:DNA-binding NarL/FixJ family response regulator